MTREMVRLPSHEAAKSQAASGLKPLAARVEQLYRDAGLAPPRPAETEVTLKVAAAELEPTLELLQRAGALVRIKDLWFHRGAVDALRARLVAFLGEHGQITPQEWKELVGATRKFTIPLAEYFDAEKVTLRIGDVRKLRQR